MAVLDLGGRDGHTFLMPDDRQDHAIKPKVQRVLVALIMLNVVILLWSLVSIR